MATHSRSKCKELLVAAIDFGTTYSGYAFSFRTQYNESPGKISCNNAWTCGTEKLISLKTPTVLLVHWDEKDKRFTREDFGFDAEKRYQGLVDEGDQENYYLVRHIKMELYSKTASSGLNRDSTLSLDKGKCIKLLQALSLAVEYLKDHLVATLQNRMDIVGPEDIRWVLTVPAIWTDAGKQMMIEAAVKAGIPGEKLTLVLEPEAASLYCMHLPSNLTEDEVKLQEGKRYIVVDAGGGTVDITVHQVNKGGGLLELHAPTGGPWGGTMVDSAFTTFLAELFGKDAFETFSQDCREDSVEMYTLFEYKKRSAGKNKQTETFRVPVSLLDIFRKFNGESGTSVDFKSSIFKDSAKLVGDKLKLNCEVIPSLFQDSVDNITTHVDELLSVCDNITAIVLVGGYGESHFLQGAFKSKYDNIQIAIPEEAGLAVVKGAVMYGHDPGKIVSRVAPFSYGVNINLRFEELLHPEAKNKSVMGFLIVKMFSRVTLQKDRI